MNASDFKNTPQWPITYWHKGGVSQPLDVSVGMVSPQLASGTNNCPSKFGGVGSMEIGQGMAAQTMNELILAKQAWQNTAYVRQPDRWRQHTCIGAAGAGKLAIQMLNSVVT